MDFMKELMPFKDIKNQRLTNKHFIEKILKEEVEEINLSSSGSKGGDNFMGSLVSFDVKTKSGEIHHLIYKGFNYEVPPQVIFTLAVQFFWKENLFYKYIMPEMEKLTPSSRKSLFPKVYDGHSDDKTDYLVIQDLRPLGFKMAEKFPGLSLEETVMVLKELGEFHAKGYHLIQEKGDDLFSGDCHRLLDNTFISRYDPSNSHFPGYNLICQNMASVLKDKRNFDLAQKMDKFASGIVPFIILPWTKAKHGELFSVLSHGDLWPNNILFKYDEHGKPLEVKFIDFQQCTKTSIYADLYYFIYCSTSPELRKQHMKTIFDTYYNAFVNELRRIGTPAIPDFTREKFEHDYFENAISAIAYCVFAVNFHLGTFSKNDEATKEDSEEKNGNGMKEENEADESGDVISFMCESMNVLADHLKSAFENSDNAMDRMRDLIVEFVELGIL